MIPLWQVISAAVATLLGGTLLGVWLTHKREYLRIKADIRKTDAETDDLTLASLERIIDRHERRILTLERQVQDCHKDRDLALTAARYLWDRLNIAAPDDNALRPLREYLERPPLLTSPSIEAEDDQFLDKLD